MENIDLAFNSLEDILSSISDAELREIIDDVDDENPDGLSVQDYFDMVMSDYHHTFYLKNNNPISEKLFDDYKIVGGKFKQNEIIRLKASKIDIKYSCKLNKVYLLGNNFDKAA